ncbi:glutamine amidotransferase class-II [Pyrolobus fumarii 1A]|uniref:Amidophosphoribosyltransferase n=1 Tax=Pyrolobus fumarii (strain DSM 11204 / 1A) TaxID=694429 RepID=G0EGU8_PYRF1|nr:amidophosphoribosyltransferase [Pyrolobus fumarii]AEM39246.1 glutamine amidotransferase class-II [Pyrolobus fumarii 1A]
MCGIAAYLGEGAARVVYELLVELQHRGHEAAGIAYLSGRSFILEGGFGLVYEAIKSHRLPSSTRLAVGHVRYSTSGPYGSLYQPLIVNVDGVELAVAFNGNIVNYKSAAREVLGRLEVDWDAWVLAAILAHYYRDEGNLADAARRTAEVLRGSYALVAATTRGELLAARDPHGIRPLAFSIGNGYAAVASETAALEALGLEWRELGRAQLLYCQGTHCSIEPLAPRADPQPCIFEYVYFSRPDSIFEGAEVYKTRVEMGRLLARIDDTHVDVVAPVPDSGRAAATGYALEKGVPLVEVLYPNRFRGRSFILPPSLRGSHVARKYGVLRSAVRGRRIALVDDSIVRGSTASRITSLLKGSGALEVHFRSASPPVVCPCVLGIDFPRPTELVARNKSVEEIRDIIGADTLLYNTIENLTRAVGRPACTACFTCVYPSLVRKYVSEFRR